MPTPTRLFEPITIGSLTLRNRIVMPPITTLYDYEGGAHLNAFYAERARGGARCRRPRSDSRCRTVP